VFISDSQAFVVAVPQVLSSKRHVEADIAALSAAQAACLAAARPFARNGANSSSTSSSLGPAAAAGDGKYAALRHELDRAFLAACKVTEWREMIQVRFEGGLVNNAVRVSAGQHPACAFCAKQQVF
jgi:hypothetical protein